MVVCYVCIYDKVSIVQYSKYHIFFRSLSCLNMLLVCALYLLLYIILIAFFLQCLILVQLKPQPFIPYVRLGSISVLHSNTLMRVGRTFFSLFNIPITLVGLHLFDTLFI